MSRSGPVAGLLLAAGAGTRFGGPKALVELAGEPLVLRALRVLSDGGCEPVLTVVGASAEQVAGLVPWATRASAWESGMGASLRAGLAELSAAGAGACVVCLVDQPAVSAAAVARLVSAWRSGAVAAAATYGGAPRNPVLLDASVWAAVAELAVGDVGARPWLRAHPGLVTAVPCDDVASPHDVDTPQDLQQLLERD